MKQLPMFSKMVELKLVVLEEREDSPKYQTLLSVEEFIFFTSDGRDMSGQPQALLLQNSGTNCSPAQMKTLELPYTGSDEGQAGER